MTLRRLHRDPPPRSQETPAPSRCLCPHLRAPGALGRSLLSNTPSLVRAFSNDLPSPGKILTPSQPLKAQFKCLRYIPPGRCLDPFLPPPLCAHIHDNAGTEELLPPVPYSFVSRPFPAALKFWRSVF